MKKFKVTASTLQKHFDETTNGIDYVQKKPSSGKNTFRCMTGYYWSKEGGDGRLRAKVEASLAKLNETHYVPFEITAMGTRWEPFKGGAKIQHQSHYWVDVKFLEVTVDK